MHERTYFYDCTCAVIIEARRVNWIPSSQVLHGCELPCECREMNSGLLQEQLVSALNS